MFPGADFALAVFADVPEVVVHASVAGAAAVPAVVIEEEKH